MIGERRAPHVPRITRVHSPDLAEPVVAAFSYELLRLGARFEGSAAMRALMAPGLWLQRITTRQPDKDQIEVAIASFQEVLSAESEAGLSAIEG